MIKRKKERREYLREIKERGEGEIWCVFDYGRHDHSIVIFFQIHQIIMITILGFLHMVYFGLGFPSPILHFPTLF